jgi:hypothetical protein
MIAEDRGAGLQPPLGQLNERGLPGVGVVVARGVYLRSSSLECLRHLIVDDIVNLADASAADGVIGAAASRGAVEQSVEPSNHEWDAAALNRANRRPQIDIVIAHAKTAHANVNLLAEATRWRSLLIDNVCYMTIHVNMTFDL